MSNKTHDNPNGVIETDKVYRYSIISPETLELLTKDPNISIKLDDKGEILVPGGYYAILKSKKDGKEYNIYLDKVDKSKNQVGYFLRKRTEEMLEAAGRSGAFAMGADGKMNPSKGKELEAAVATLPEHLQFHARREISTQEKDPFSKTLIGFFNGQKPELLRSSSNDSAIGPDTPPSSPGPSVGASSSSDTSKEAEVKPADIDAIKYVTEAEGFVFEPVQDPKHPEIAGYIKYFRPELNQDQRLLSVPNDLFDRDPKLMKRFEAVSVGRLALLTAKGQEAIDVLANNQSPMSPDLKQQLDLRRPPAKQQSTKTRGTNSIV